jgi:hypothetical protein
MTWQEYEKLVFKQITLCYPNAKCEFNSKILGKYSKGLRQCDVIVRENFNGIERITLIDAKYYSKKIDVKAVEMFISMSNDINADYGMLITPLGYSELAYNRAENDPSKILLDILTLNDLMMFQGYCAIPYAGENSVLLSPAFGWIIDATKRDGMVASTYRKGFDFDSAYKEKEFIYFNFWDTKKDYLTKIELLETQVENIKKYSKVIESKIDLITINNKELAIRKTISENYLATEYACAVEYEDFIFFGVLITPENRKSVNIEKLINMISKTLPIKVVQK